MILELFLAFLQVGALSIGGGYVAMPLLQSLTVNSHHWLTMQEFADLISIAEMTPGPIAINAATFIGVRLGGAGGIAAAVVGFITPSLVLVTLSVNQAKVVPMSMEQHSSRESRLLNNARRVLFLVIVFFLLFQLFEPMTTM